MRTLRSPVVPLVLLNLAFVGAWPVACVSTAAQPDGAATGNSSPDATDSQPSSSGRSEADSAHEVSEGAGETSRGEDGDETTDDASLDPAWPVPLRDEHNARLVATADLPVVDTVPGDLKICWHELTNNFKCESLDPSNDVAKLELLRFRDLTRSTIQEMFATTGLPQSLIDGYLIRDLQSGEQCARLREFGFFGSSVDISEEFQESDDTEYLLVASDQTTPGVGPLAAMFLNPRENSETTEIELPSGCGQISFEADIESRTRLHVPDVAPWPVHWRQLRHTAHGDELHIKEIDKLRVARMTGVKLRELERRVLELESLATDIWELGPFPGPEAELAKAVHSENGSAFPGFASAGSGIWVLSLECSTCERAAPLFLAVVEPA